jgi:hypothetical protein
VIFQANERKLFVHGRICCLLCQPWTFYIAGIHDKYSLIKNERMFAVKCGPSTTYTINSDSGVKLNFKAHIVYENNVRYPMSRKFKSLVQF